MTASRTPLSAEGLDSLARAVQQRLGARVHPPQRAALARSAQSLIVEDAARDVAEIVSRTLEGSLRDPVVRRMTEAASIGETYFFRAPEQLKALRALVESRLVSRWRRARPLRVWSAGCATGEEAYTLAVLFENVVAGTEVRVVGTDMNEAALEVARAGVYGARSFRRLAPDSMGGLRRRGEAWEVAPEIRRRVSFAALNLVTDRVPDLEAGITGFDVVVCRNVLMYIDRSRVSDVVRRVSQTCAPNAIIAVSPSDAAVGLRSSGFSKQPHALYLREAAQLRDLSARERAPRRDDEARVPRTTSIPQPSSPPPSPSPVPATAPSASPSAPPAPDDSATTLAKAFEAADRGRLDVARRLAEELLAGAPDSSQGHYLLGVVAAAEKDPSAAEAMFRRSIFLDRGFVAAELGLADALSQTGQDDDARRHYRRVLRLLGTLADDQIVEPLGMTVRAVRRLAEQALDHGGEGT